MRAGFENAATRCLRFCSVSDLGTRPLVRVPWAVDEKDKVDGQRQRSGQPVTVTIRRYLSWTMRTRRIGTGAIAAAVQVGVRAGRENVVPCSIHGYAMWKPRDTEKRTHRRSPHRVDTAEATFSRHECPPHVSCTVCASTTSLYGRSSFSFTTIRLIV